MLHILRALAVYRLARLIALEEGLGGALMKFRRNLGAYDYGADGLPLTNLGRGVCCPHCVGVYVAVLVYLLPGWAEPLITILGLAGAQSFLQSLSRE